MLNLKNMQNKVNKLLSVFTKIIKELDTQITVLNTAIDTNNSRIAQRYIDNVAYSEKIKEYSALKENIEHIIK